MSKIEKAVQNMISMANNDIHGYDQSKRWGPNYDCSSAVITALENAGIPAKSKGATYTGNMRRVLLNIGFSEIINKVNISTGEGLQRGDICLRENGHVVMYIGNNQIVHSSINEKGTTTGGKTGDQTGKEFCVRSYYNGKWNSILRYAESKTEETSQKKSVDEVAREVIAGKWGNGNDRKTRLSQAGYSYTEVQQRVNQIIKGENKPKKSVDEVAREVIAGKWGNGNDRKTRLSQAGYSYTEIQQRVNQILRG